MGTLRSALDAAWRMAWNRVRRGMGKSEIHYLPTSQVKDDECLR